MNEQRRRQAAGPGWLTRLAWIPVPVLLVAMAGLWAADLRAGYESRVVLLLLNFFFTGLASACIALLAGLGFLAGGERGSLMLGCGSLLWGAATLSGSAFADHGANIMITIHNLGVWAAAWCHLAGLVWPGRVRRRAGWLMAGYGAVVGGVAALAWVAHAGWLPVFFVEGEGGTPLRVAVLASAVAVFLLTAALMLRLHRRQPSVFFYWYGLGLAVLAVGLAGVLVQSVRGGVLGWTGRVTQSLGGVYLLAASLAAAREAGGGRLALAAADRVWSDDLLLALRKRSVVGASIRYGATVLAVALAWGGRALLEAAFGPGLPPYITFYPMVMAVALLAGLGPGLVATALTCLIAHCWILPLDRMTAAATPMERLGQVVFGGMGVLVSAAAASYHRYRRKAAAYDREAAVRESEQRIQQALRVSHSFTFDWEPASDRVLRSASCAAILGEAQEGLGRDYFQLIHADDRARFLQVLQGLKPAADAYSIEYRLTRSDGRPLVLEEVGQGTFDDGGQLQRVVGVATDITAHRQVEEALRVSRADLKRAQEVGQIGWWRLDFGRNELTWSDENHRIFGVAPGTPLTYETFLDLVHPEDRTHVDTRWQAGQRGEPYDVEHRILANGQVKWVREKAYLEFDRAGHPVGAFGISQDITVRKRAEERVRASLAEKDVLLREIHHRVKNNLQVIASLISLQADTHADDRLRGLLADVRNRVRTMALVHEMLYEKGDLARLDFADYAARLLQYLWSSRGAMAGPVRLTLAIAPMPLSVGRALHCGLILNELASNALQHAFPDGRGGEVVVRTQHDAASGTVRLEVRDNGVGLPAGTDWRQAGSLGLRLVQMLAGQLHGTVQAGPGPGTAFEVTFTLEDPSP